MKDRKINSSLAVCIVAIFGGLMALLIIYIASLDYTVAYYGDTTIIYTYGPLKPATTTRPYIRSELR